MSLSSPTSSTARTRARARASTRASRGDENAEGTRRGKKRPEEEEKKPSPTPFTHRVRVPRGGRARGLPHARIPRVHGPIPTPAPRDAPSARARRDGRHRARRVERLRQSSLVGVPALERVIEPARPRHRRRFPRHARHHVAVSLQHELGAERGHRFSGFGGRFEARRFAPASRGGAVGGFTSFGRRSRGFLEGFSRRRGFLHAPFAAPHANGSVVPRGGEEFAPGRGGDGGDGARVSHEKPGRRRLFELLRDAPRSNHAVVSARDEHAPGGALFGGQERDGGDRRGPVAGGEFAREFPRGEVESRGAVVTTGGDGGRPPPSTALTQSSCAPVASGDGGPTAGMYSTSRVDSALMPLRRRSFSREVRTSSPSTRKSKGLGGSSARRWLITSERP